MNNSHHNKNLDNKLDNQSRRAKYLKSEDPVIAVIAAYVSEGMRYDQVVATLGCSSEQMRLGVAYALQEGLMSPGDAEAYLSILSKVPLGDIVYYVAGTVLIVGVIGGIIWAIFFRKPPEGVQPDAVPSAVYYKEPIRRYFTFSVLFILFVLVDSVFDIMRYPSSFYELSSIVLLSFWSWSPWIRFVGEPTPASTNKAIIVRLRDFLMKDVTESGFKYLRVLIVRLSTVYALFLYGILLYIYYRLKALPFIGYILSDWDRIYFCQILAVYFYPFSTCAFHMGLHSFLMGMEDIFYYLNHDKKYLKSISLFLKLLRRSPFRFTALIGRVGSHGFSGGIGDPPHGNWRRLVAWTGVAITAIVVNAGVKVYKAREQGKVDMDKTRTQGNVDMHKTTTQGNVDMHKTDAKFKAKEGASQRAWDNYREDKKSWDSRSIWTRGNPPNPPTN